MLAIHVYVYIYIYMYITCCHTIKSSLWNKYKMIHVYVFVLINVVVGIVKVIKLGTKIYHPHQTVDYVV